MKQTRAARFVYDGLGFPVILINVPVRDVRGVVVPDINYNTLRKLVLEDLSLKPSSLTGNELRFIRQFMGLTYTEFAKHFEAKSTEVIAWERAKDSIARVAPSTKTYIRLYILQHLNATKCLKPSSGARRC